MQYTTKEVSTTRPADAKALPGKVRAEVEVPAFESYEEFEASAGSTERAMEFINGAVATAAVNSGRVALRDSEGDEEAVIAKTRATTRSYTPTGGGERLGVKTAGKKALSLIEKLRTGDTLSEAEETELELIAAKFGA